MVIERFKTGRRPYRILFHPDGKSFFVTSWADGTRLPPRDRQRRPCSTGCALGAAPHGHGLARRASKPTPPDEEQPFAGCGAPVRRRLQHQQRVCASASPRARSCGCIEVINVSMTPRQPAGMTPSALAAQPGPQAASSSSARTPTPSPWPTSRGDAQPRAGLHPHRLVSHRRARARRRTAGGAERPRPALAIRTRKGRTPRRRRARARGHRRDRVRGAHPDRHGVASSTRSTDEQLDGLHQDRHGELAVPRHLLTNAGPAGTRSRPPRRPSPIEHVIYIVKENRTYDQVFGDLKEGNGDPSLVLFGEEVTPNHHKLAREFVLLDNFYVNSDVSADGHNWSTAAIAPDYVQKLWPNSYARAPQALRLRGRGAAPRCLPPAISGPTPHAAGVSMRNLRLLRRPTARKRGTGRRRRSTVVRDPVLAPRHQPATTAASISSYPDVERAKVFLDGPRRVREDRPDAAPACSCAWATTTPPAPPPGKIAPLSALADNDAALGHDRRRPSRRAASGRRRPSSSSRTTRRTAPDHVDSHRSPAFVISPYTRRGVGGQHHVQHDLDAAHHGADSRPAPDDAFDAGARPMSAAFQSTPDPAPYTAEKPRIPLDERNPAARPPRRARPGWISARPTASTTTS